MSSSMPRIILLRRGRQEQWRMLLMRRRDLENKNICTGWRRAGARERWNGAAKRHAVLRSRRRINCTGVGMFAHDSAR